MSRSIRSVAAFLAVFVALPTVIPLLLSDTPVRPLVNLDYFIAGAALIVAPLWAFLLLYVGALLADALRIAAAMFYFRPVEFLSSVVFVPSLDRTFVALLTLASASAVTLLAVGIYRHLPRPRSGRRAAMLVVAAAGAVALVDAMTSGNLLWRRDSAVLAANLATSSSVAVLRSLHVAVQERGQDGSIVQGPAPAATDVLRRALRDGVQLPPRLILVISESWGLPRDAGAAAFIRDALDSAALQQRYRIDWGTVPFFASTVPGEIRELCGVKVNVVAPRPDKLPSDCLPAALGERGYRTTAVHGFAGSFFNRQAWYPALGFDEALFMREIDEEAPVTRHCGSVFRGHCDADSFRRAVHRIEASGPQFLYWLTLNAHVPVVDGPDTADCLRRAPRLGAVPVVCQLLALNRRVLEVVGDWAAARPAGDAGIVIVGDHAPPLLDPDARAEFDPQRVPFVVLWPKPVS